MKNYKSLISLAMAGCMAASLSSCRDDMKEINDDPSKIAITTPAQLFTVATWEFSPTNYGIWFFNAPGFHYTSQLGIPSGGMGPRTVTGGSQRDGIQTINLQRYVYAMKDEISKLSEEDQSKNAKIAAALDVLVTYLGIYDTDDCGDIPFTEASQAQYGGTMTPKYDRVADLYTLWDNTLKEAITVLLSDRDTEQGNYDLIYGRDWNKWAKLANGVRLKLATRLIHQDLARAKSIVAEVIASPAGLMNGEGDNFAYRKADQNISSGGSLDAGDVAYNTGNGTISYNGEAASKPFTDFLIKNGDPRVRFIFTKNAWNSKVVDFYLRNGHEDQIPSFILANVKKSADGGFGSWEGTGIYAGKGEPWVRYYGLPTTFRPVEEGTAADWEYFKYSETKANGGNQVAFEGTNYAFRPYSMFNEELVSGRVDFSPYRAPGDFVNTDNNDVPHFGQYMTTGEINYYLAEFAVYGGVAGLGNANDYFQKAVRASVEEWDRVAAENKIPYYGTNYGYDENDMPIDLQEGEIEALLAQPDYQLTGDKDSDLEKIFLNLLVHFAYQPKDEFVTARRSGIPKFNSSIMPRVDYAANNIPVNMYPRRTFIDNPNKTSLMYNNILESLNVQGFTPGETANGELNKERVWQDQGAPQYGEGPNVK